MKIQITDKSFSYDVYALVKAFFPDEDINIDCGVDEGASQGEPGTADDKSGGEESRSFSAVFICGDVYRLTVPYGGETKSEYKNKVKREIYKYLSEKTGKKLPWGILTGIRPTKLPMKMLEDNKTVDIIRGRLRDTYLISDEKIDLSIEIAKRERCIIDRLHKSDGFSLYIGIPFCPSTCMYCSFTSYPISKYKDVVRAYLDALKKEIDFVADVLLNNASDKNISRDSESSVNNILNEELHTNTYKNNNSSPIYKLSKEYIEKNNRLLNVYSENKNLSDDENTENNNPTSSNSNLRAFNHVDSIYIGGGTPTTLEPDELNELLTYINERIGTKDTLEFCVEAGRPDSITEEKLRVLKANGVNRISVNPQTLNESTLRTIGRNHTVDDFYRAYEMAGKYFENINIDLILGLPGENTEMVKNTFTGIEKLNPTNLTVHSMAIKRAAKMDEFLKSNPEIKSEIPDEVMTSLHNLAAQMSLNPYYLYRQKNMTGNFENIGFAKNGFEGIYNIAIMEEVQSIVALGAGSISKRVYPDGLIERCDNVKDVKFYIEKIDEMIARKRVLFGV